MDGRGSLNILVSSSRQWNPGDEFIMLGVRRLLAALFGQDLNYILWNRNPDLFMDRWSDSMFRPGFLTNSAVEPSLDVIDLVVLAGTPEWHGRPVERIFHELLRFPGVPLLALGVGGAGPGFVFSPLEYEIFTRENTLLVCRNPMLAGEIDALIGPKKAHLMPCPAIFCSAADQSRSVSSLALAPLTIAVQGDSVENQAAPTDFVEQVIRFMLDVAQPSEFCYVAHYIDEFLRFSRLRKSATIFYSYEPLDYLEFYRNGSRALVTSRLHGAIASLSCGTPACLTDFGSDRLNNAALPFGDLLPSFGFDDAIAWLRGQSVDGCAEFSDKVLLFKKQMFNRYFEILKPFTDRFVNGVD